MGPGSPLTLLSPIFPIFAGHVTAGNTARYLPLILQFLSDSERPQYLLLLSLKEVILTHNSLGLDFSAYVAEVREKGRR